MMLLRWKKWLLETNKGLINYFLEVVDVKLEKFNLLSIYLLYIINNIMCDWKKNS